MRSDEHRRGRPPARFIWRFGVFFALFLLTVGGFLAAGVWALATAVGLIGASWPVRGLAIGLLVFAVAGLPRLRRLWRRAAIPIAALVEAAGQIEGGDYGARVPERGPRDVRSLARAFNAMSERLEAVDSQRRSFLADVAHELRTPLTVIQGRLEAMLDGVDERDDEQLERILNQAQTLDRVVEDLRTAALAETGSLVFEREPTELGALLAETARDFRPEAERHGVTLSEDFSAAALTCDVDPVRMRQLLGNLLTNALRHTPDGGEIFLSMSRDGGQARIDVADTGSGIPVELTDTLFERFTKSSESPGVGLGLAIARDIAVAHGGTISAEHGRAGALFRVTLPLGSL